MRAMKCSNETLQYERLCRHWTQQYVADAIGTTKINVSRWERGITRPGPYFRLKLCTLFAKSEQELGMASGAQNPPFANLDTTLEHITAAIQHPRKAMLIQEPLPEKLLFALARSLSEGTPGLKQSHETLPLHVYIVFGGNVE